MIKYSAATGFLAVAAVMLLSPFLHRARQKSCIISAAVGIIVYTIVKSIFVECGWGLATAAGPYAGILAETVMFGCGIAFFGELKKTFPGENGTERFSLAGVMLVIAGKNLSADCLLMPDLTAFIVGRAAQSALLIVSADLMSDEAGEKGIPFLPAAAVICMSISTLAELIVRRMPESTVSAAAPMLILAGCSHLTVELSGSFHSPRKISAGGLAAGWMLSYCFDCLAA